MIALDVGPPVARRDRVVAVDVNERARTLCAANAVGNGIGNVEVLAPDEVDPAAAAST